MVNSIVAKPYLPTPGNTGRNQTLPRQDLGLRSVGDSREKTGRQKVSGSLKLKIYIYVLFWQATDEEEVQMSIDITNDFD